MALVPGWRGQQTGEHVTDGERADRRHRLRCRVVDGVLALDGSHRRAAAGGQGVTGGRLLGLVGFGVEHVSVATEHLDVFLVVFFVALAVGGWVGEGQRLGALANFNGEHLAGRSLRWSFMAERNHIGEGDDLLRDLVVDGAGQLADVFETTVAQELEDFSVPLVVLEVIRSSSGSIRRVNMRLDRDMAATTATLPAAFAASMQDLARTVVSRGLRTLEDTMTAGCGCWGSAGQRDHGTDVVGKPW